jgi:hypothetical protein
MLNTQSIKLFGTVTLAACLAGLTACSSLPGEPRTQGAVIGGLGGAAAGAAIGGKGNQVLGALLGGALGATGGYIIGANSDRITDSDRAAAQEAVQTAQTRPATARDVMAATTADVNGDGFVTLDEVVAMRQAGLSDQQMLERLRLTGQVFELTAEQEQHLRSQGVSAHVVNQMQDINRDLREQLLGQQSGVIGQPR